MTDTNDHDETQTCHFCGHKETIHPLLVEGWASADGGAAEAWMDERSPRVTCRGVFDVEA